PLSIAQHTVYSPMHKNTQLRLFEPCPIRQVRSARCVLLSIHPCHTQQQTKDKCQCFHVFSDRIHTFLISYNLCSLILKRDSTPPRDEVVLAKQHCFRHNFSASDSDDLIQQSMLSLFNIFLT